ncbi:diphosphomevalonate decarboxylase [Salinibius halmophilus]|uniref:diphosphomevalonate decarboxylase n=1 Tax=Salinibius halmophilus TaxID=1853216 RepID=UPI0018F7959D|nr:diphosphomevalonate decarboxylase [Salinibius halmophilus]
MNKADFLSATLAGRRIQPMQASGSQFAPVNIALGKYWGKRNIPGNLPTNDSLSITLPNHGSTTTITASETDLVILNGKQVNPEHAFYRRLFEFLDALDGNRPRLRVETNNNIATAAGLASSASGFAALIGALNDLCQWQLTDTEWSILARIGSGSACRSIANGFVRWHRGERDNGKDSFAQPIDQPMPNLAIGLLTLTDAEKPIGSTAGMKQTLATCPLFNSWPQFANASVERIAQYIETGDLIALLNEAEHNAMTMHATMIATNPSILYWQPESVATMHKVRALRSDGLDVYLTMDAGPNVKLLFDRRQQADVLAAFPNAELILPFEHA